jgi:hypothetical protein
MYIYSFKKLALGYIYIYSFTKLTWDYTRIYIYVCMYSFTKLEWGFIYLYVYIYIFFYKTCVGLYIYIYVFFYKTCMGLQFSSLSTPPTVGQSAVGQGFTFTLGRTMLDGTPLDEWSARHRDFYLTTHHTHKRQTSLLPTGFEPAITARERPQTHALNARPLGTGHFTLNQFRNLNYMALISPLHHDNIRRFYFGTIMENTALRYPPAVWCSEHVGCLL